MRIQQLSVRFPTFAGDRNPVRGAGPPSSDSHSTSWAALRWVGGRESRNRARDNERIRADQTTVRFVLAARSGSARRWRRPQPRSAPKTPTPPKNNNKKRKKAGRENAPATKKNLKKKSKNREFKKKSSKKKRGTNNRTPFFLGKSACCALRGPTQRAHSLRKACGLTSAFDPA